MIVNSRSVGFAVVALAYALAGAVALLVSWLMRAHHPLTVAFVADLAATVVVFALSTVVANASLYDPYWSVAPPVIVLAWIGTGPSGVDGVRQFLVAAVTLVWAVRLTGNWAWGWSGLAQEDWRYVQIREQTAGRVPWWLVNFTGIQLMPTLVVFAGLLAAWPAVGVPNRGVNWLDGLAVAVALGATAIEAVADLQLRGFARDPNHRGRIADTGLWRYSRHPNYLGEILFWWGIWLFALAAAPGWWWTVVGPLAMVVLFVFVSVPLMDKRSLARRPAYEEHMRRVPALLPVPGRRAARQN